MEPTKRNEELPKATHGATLPRLPAIASLVKGGSLSLPFVESARRNNLEFVTAHGDS